MKKFNNILKMSCSLAVMLLILVACNNAAELPTDNDAGVEPIAEVLQAPTGFDGREFLNWFYQYGQWRTLENASPVTNHPGGFVIDSSGRPTNEDIELILNTASLAVTSGGRTDWYMVVVKDTDAQNEIIGEIEEVSRATSDGTVTVLIFSERLIREDLRTDEVIGFAPDRGYYNVGILTGYLNMAAVSLGYGTRMFMTPNIPGNGFRDGERWLEAEHFLDGRTYVVGSTGDEFSTENMKLVNAVVIGTPAPIEDEVDGITHATTRLFPRNWSIWDPANATGPIIPEVEENENEVQAQTPSESNFTDGVFTGVAYGFFNVPLVLEVTVENGAIVSIEILEHGETEEYFVIASEGFGETVGMIPQIIEAQHLELDGVSGATATSVAILEAVANALGLE